MPHFSMLIRCIGWRAELLFSITLLGFCYFEMSAPEIGAIFSQCLVIAG